MDIRIDQSRINQLNDEYHRVMLQAREKSGNKNLYQKLLEEAESMAQMIKWLAQE